MSSEDENKSPGAGSSAQTITPFSALRLVSEFFDTEWPATTLNDVDLRPITGGFCHRLHLLTRTTPAKLEPSQILIRHFGRTNEVDDPMESNTTLSSAEQSLIYHEMGRRGWGPLLYGTFRGGRLEEYIDSHPLTADDCKDPEIQRDVARSYARLHSLDLPFRKRNFSKVINEFKLLTAYPSILKISQRLETSPLIQAKEFAGILRNTRWDRELEWVSETFEKCHCKKTIAIGDANYLNILVKNYPSECRTMLIDYETATYSYRGIDLGGHFNERMYAWSDPDTPFTGHPIPAKSERRDFCASYLQEMRNLGQDLTEWDTIDHLMVESEVGQLYQLMFSVFMGLEYEAFGEEPTLLTGLIHMLETYLNLKSTFARTNTP